MKYTVELTENGITETLELNGIIYKKNGQGWKTVYFSVHRKISRSR